MYEKITLKNGVRVVYEHLPYVRSAAMGIWVGIGSANERAAENGAAHFIEHMVFKGTSSRSAADIAEQMDAMGGQVNAFTAKECTCFYVRALGEHISAASEILCDMFFNSRFDDADIKNELGVILEEIGMYKDSPEDLAADTLLENVFRSSSLGRPILGKPSTIGKMDGAFLKSFMASHYGAKQTVVSLCGCFDDGELKRICDRFSAMPALSVRAPARAAYAPAFAVKRKKTDQNHLCIGFPCLSSSDERRYAVQLMSNILGGGMSSRLFQGIREKLGLCYSIYTFTSCYRDTGAFAVYTALAPEAEEAAIEAVLKEIRRFREDGVSEDELARAREQVKSNVLMGLESTSALCSSSGRSELMLGRVVTADDLIEAYGSVTREQILSAAREFLDFERLSFSAVGRVRRAEEYRELLQKC